MTNISLRAPEQSSRFTGAVASIFMTVMILLVGAVSIAQFAG
jgi:hypothetical protein